MSVGEVKTPPAVGFLTVVDSPQLGLVGGYLVLNLLGRPLEFHCTTPVKPNRAQQILYGPTLEPYLYGEQIGQTLVSKASIKPLVVCTDLAAALAVRQHVALPVALVRGEADAAKSVKTELRRDGAHVLRGPSLAWFRLGQQELAVDAMYGGDQATIVSRLGEMAQAMDLSEPFGRIRDAIEEAQRGGR